MLAAPVAVAPVFYHQDLIWTDMDFRDMVKTYGSQETRKIWDLTLWTLREIQFMVRRARLRCDFVKNGSLVVALRKSELPLLKEEFRLRKRYGYRVRLLPREEVKNLVKADVASALYSPFEAVFNQAKFIVGLAKHCAKKIRIFERTPAMSIVRKGDEYAVTTPKGEIIAKKIILATGGATAHFVKVKQRFNSFTTFEIATRPLRTNELRTIRWRRGYALWPLGRFYDYLRLTADNRLIVGVEDSKIDIDIRKRQKHFRRLQKFLITVFPQLKDVAIDYKWSGVVQATRREHPVVGRIGNIFYGFAHGGHGLLMASYVGGPLAHLAAGTSKKRFAHPLFHKKAPLDKHIMAKLLN